MSRATLNRHRMQGLTLVETMVAITISLILMGGAITLFINNKTTYQVNDNMSRLQENARFAIEFMIQDLRMGGYFGCNNSSEKVTNSFTTGAPGDTASLSDTANPLEGFDETLLAWSPSGDTQIVNTIGIAPNGMVANTDAFTVRHLAGDNQPVVGAAINVLTLDDASSFDIGDPVAVSDCGGTVAQALADLDSYDLTGTYSVAIAQIADTELDSEYGTDFLGVSAPPLVLNDPSFLNNIDCYETANFDLISTGTTAGGLTVTIHGGAWQLKKTGTC